MARTACLVIAALVATAGCAGGDNGRLSKSEYEAKLRVAFGAAAAELRPAQGSADSPAVVARIARAYGGIASKLKHVRPPADAQALNARLVAGAASQAAALHALAVKLARAPKAARDRLLAEFDASSISGQAQFDRAVAGLRAKGYRFSPSAGT
jgi:hypothetical protein